MKKITYVLASAIFMFCGILQTSAATKLESNTYSDDIVFHTLYQNHDNYIDLKGDLKNEGAKVYQQYVKITKEQFNAINTNIKGINNYRTEQEKVIKEKKAEVDAAKKVLDNTPNPTGSIDINKVITAIDTNNENLTITQPEYEVVKASDYYEAYTKYQNLKKEYEQYVNTYSVNLEQKVTDMYNSITRPDDTKWNELTLTKKDTSVNKYKVTFPNEYDYFISWVKVLYNNNDEYNFKVYCKDSIKETPNTPITPNKPVTPKNPKTGIKEYCVYTALIAMVALSGYVVVKKYRKFSK